MHRQAKWQAIIGPILAGTPFELVGVECVGGGKHTVVRVYIDKPGGITLDDIVQLSREMSVVLDVEEPIQGHYTLEVSSPGLDRPLFLPAHFMQQVGQKVYLRARHAEAANRQNFKGVLLSADEKAVQVDVDGQVYSFSYDDVEKAKVIANVQFGTSGNKEAKR
jgi:ribosome maturation factor RimP